MGWTVLYIAFGFVALWLLGEVLLQYKARLRWRLVAFFGFLGVVIGVLVNAVPVIALGAAAFATGQTFVTLSFRRGFSTGWALGGKPGTSRRRRASRGEEEPAGEEAGEHGAPPFPPPPPPAPSEAPESAEPAYAGAEFGGEIYGGQPYAEPYQEGYREPAAEASYGEPYPGAYQENYAAATGYTEQGQYLAGGTDGYGYQTGWEGSGEYAAQADQLGQPTGFGGAEPPGYTDESSVGGQWGQGGGTPTYQETPPGGVWVPQQREPAPDDAEGYGWAQQQPEGYPQQTGYDSSGQGYYYNNDGRY
ncbi:hypothetical protein [Streptomyces profundus]|uniref:hypothetical protein n=1 Tax=Streptomyces profundus TaxID=2867410 RepID=UPI001D16B9F0|nr:hypothetical protein [Streptomyces sp. MA3_2.13]UED83695.1 hypothetical protein K4G22_05280 [Streptomyces sp. MA3_2.13]